jgi:hypothetical protein
MNSRANASPATVRELAMLLRRPSYRFIASRMLYDVEGHLGYASAELERALSDQIAAEDGYVERARPFMVTNERTVSSSLRCVLRKSRGEATNEGDCIALEMYNGDEG